MSAPVAVTAEWVRAAVVAAQHIPAPRAVGEYDDAADVLRGIGLIQLDPLTRVSTAQRLTALTRLPRSSRDHQIDAALWPAADQRNGSPVAFEALTKVACIFPIQDWPLLHLRRERFRDRYEESIDSALRRRVFDTVASDAGGVQIGTIESALGGPRTTGWNWSEVKKTAELMVGMGELVITSRNGTVRLFDLPERALPESIRQADELPVEHLHAALASRAAESLAVMTTADLAHHYHLSRADAARGIELAGLTPVDVPGWRDQAFTRPETLDVSAATVTAPAALARLIGPFDPLLRDRGRARRIFGFDYTFEAYVPKTQRIYGHYVMAVLSGNDLVGRADVQRVGPLLHVNRVFPEPGHTTRSVRARVRASLSTLATQLAVEPVMSEPSAH